MMTKIEGEATLLRVFFGESDHHHGRPMSTVLVRLAREMGLAGATVLRGLEGFGASSRIHSAHILRLSEDLPLVLEVVDTRERLDPFLERVEGIVDDTGCGVLITLEKAQIIRYRPRGDGNGAEES